ncbi:unnamed protein product [Vicia faba]|uniref:Uncharacterized protein n=1 Tax=Vicia faba TaxID=3906 RepID=A0AAV0YE89_VICFA|nr:unnamed protein product [Vicia faba]
MILAELSLAILLFPPPTNPFSYSFSKSKAFLFVVKVSSKEEASRNQCCAVFGTEIRPTAECGRTMYIIRQRIDLLLMRMQKKHEASGFKGQTSYKNVKRKQLLDEDYVTKIADFGVAEISQTGFSFFAGTHGYISRGMLKPDEAAVASYNFACYSKLNHVPYVKQLGAARTQAPIATNYDVGSTTWVDLRLAPLLSAMEVTLLGHGPS